MKHKSFWTVSCCTLFPEAASSNVVKLHPEILKIKNNKWLLPKNILDNNQITLFLLSPSTHIWTFWVSFWWIFWSNLWIAIFKKIKNPQQRSLLVNLEVQSCKRKHKSMSQKKMAVIFWGGRGGIHKFQPLWCKSFTRPCRWARKTTRQKALVGGTCAGIFPEESGCPFYIKLKQIEKKGIKSSSWISKPL